MVLPDFVKSPLVVYLVAVFAVLAVIGVLALNFSQGTFVDDQGCKWIPMENPETDEPFTSESELQNYFESYGEQVPDGLQVQVRDGVLHQKTICSGGGSL
jgi:hypothetical protein